MNTRKREFNSNFSTHFKLSNEAAAVVTGSRVQPGKLVAGAGKKN
jgi:hypothetical protein